MAFEQAPEKPRPRPGEIFDRLVKANVINPRVTLADLVKVLDDADVDLEGAACVVGAWYFVYTDSPNKK